MEQAGRLTLSWIHRDQALASDSAGYTWVDSSDVRVSEVRLLEDVGTSGDVGHDDRTRAADNLIIEGDSLHALRSLTRLPEYRKEYQGKVRLVYIDPPFNTGQAFSQYDDGLEHSVWLTMMRDRLTLIRDLLAPDGSLWVHLDDTEMAYCRILLDEIFGRSKFLATIVWQKRYSRDNRPAIGDVHDYIIVFSPAGDAWKQSRNRVPRTAAKEYRNPNNDPRGPWRVIPMTAQGYRLNQMYEIETPAGAIHRPPKGRCWSMVRETFDEFLAAGKVYFGKDGRAQPGIIRYLDEDEGLVPWTWWPHEEVGHNDESKKEMLELFSDREAFATPKPERLLYRVIHIATNSGDIVLDCFAGSGTTAAVAHKMGRRWVAIEREPSNVKDFIQVRLEKVVSGQDAGGVTETAGWKGGGGFRTLRVAPSSYEQVDGRVFLADWVTNGRFAEAVCAQLGYQLEHRAPFVGRKGRTRLAAVDGIADETVIAAIVARLEANERAVVVARGMTEEATAVLRSMSPGSRLKKAPRDILPLKGRVQR